MKKTKFTEEQIAFALRPVHAGVSPASPGRTSKNLAHGVSILHGDPVLTS